MGRRLLYVYIGDCEEKSGVANKLNGIFTALAKKGVEWTMFTLAGSADKIGFSTPSRYVLPMRFFKDQVGFYEELHKFIQANPAFDTYFLRYPFASKALADFLEKHPGKFSIEHNTIEMAEVKNNARFWIRKYKFRPTLSYVRLIINGWFKPVYIEKYYGKKILSLAKNGIAVTQEIAGYEKQRYPDYKCKVVANGIDVEKIQHYERTFKQGDILKLILLVNSNSAWHGTDIILNSLAKWGKDTIQLYLVGTLDDSIKTLAAENKNIITTGHLSVAEYQSFLKEAHVGIGSLSLYRIHLKEASPLKVREYLASGLPVIVGYFDTDIEASAGLKKYACVIDTQKNEMDWNSIYNWAANLYSDKTVNHQIRELAFKQLDFSNKVEQLVSA